MSITIETILKSGSVNEYKHQWNYQEVIKNNRDKIFIYDYPISPLLKDDFETHFCTHFYKHEISFQNIGMWCYYLSEHLNNIFPYMNTYFEKIGNYDELITNLGYEETVLHEHQESGKYNTKQKDKISNDNTRLGRDFSNSEIPVDSTRYYTDSDSTKGMQDRDFTQDDTDTRNFSESETIKHLNNDNINVYDFLNKYRNDIDSIYDIIYQNMSDLFIAIL